MAKQPRRIVCQSCGTLFGMLHEDGTLTIKNRDLYRHIVGGVVSGPCRKCGAEVRYDPKAT